MSRRGWFFVLFSFLCATLALAAYWPSWPGDPHTLPTCPCGDTVQQSWFLYWTPWALLHGHNPLFTSWINWPVGANLAQNTAMPLLGVVTAPISLIFGPVSSFNLLMWAAYPLSALSMAWVARRWTASNSASLAAGLVYGFSQYIVGEGQAHLNLSFVPLPPLIIAAAFEVFVRHPPNRRRWGVALGILVCAQFLISSEVLASTAIVCLIAAIIVGIARRRELDRKWMRETLEGLIPGVAIAIIVLAYPAYFLLAGPEHLTVAIQGSSNAFRADLLAPFLPTHDAALAPTGITALTDKFTANITAENGSYLGVPLIVTIIVATIRYRRDRWIVLLAAMGVIAAVLALGPTLTAAEHTTSLRLPFDLLAHISVVDNVLPSRLSLYVTFCAATLIALAIAHFVQVDPGSPTSNKTGGDLRGWAFDGVIALLIVAVVVSLTPRWPITTYPIDQAAFFGTNEVNRIPSGSNVLTYPFAVSPFNHAMLWQTRSGMRFKLIGGYAINPGPDHGVSPWPPLLAPADVQEFLGWEEYDGPIGYIEQTPPVVDEQLISDVRTYLRIHQVRTVIVDLSVAPNVAPIVSVLERAIGRAPQTEAGVDVWFNLNDGPTELSH